MASRVAYAASIPTTPFGYYFGGLVTDTSLWGTWVIAIGPPGVWQEERVACEKGYTGVNCEMPLCQHQCWNLGRCIAPDLCECLDGFTGPLCGEQRCTTCEVNLASINQQILWTRAQHRAFQCMSQIEALIAQIRSQLPPFSARCGQPYTNGDYPIPLRNTSRDSWNFEVYVSAPLAALSAATAEFLASSNLA